MHGIIFLALEDFLEARCGEGAWSQAMREANLVEQRFAPDCFYPDEGATDLFRASAKVLHLSLAQTLEALGRHMSSDLISLGRSMGLVREAWTTLDLLEHLPKEILAAFGNASAGMKPPDIRTYRLKYAEVAVAYVSERKLCPLLKGIVLGMGEFFNEPIRIEERLCMLENAPLCRLSVYLDSPTLKNHIEISREFQAVHSRIQEIRFFNQFAGIPVVNQGLVLQYGKDSVLVQIHPESLLAMRTEGLTYLALPHLPIGLKAHVASVDGRHGTATLQQIVATDGPIGRRLQSRVVPDQPIGIELRIRKQTVRGGIGNLSEGGICVILRNESPIDESMLFTPVQMRFTLPVHSVDSAATDEPTAKILLDGNLLHIDKQGERHRVRIVFRPLTVNNAQWVRRYYLAREQQASHQLRTLIAAEKEKQYGL
ncbi:MAG: heme NO-binding domain-containing protein [Magnetococcus sp. MYC-9]